MRIAVPVLRRVLLQSLFLLFLYSFARFLFWRANQTAFAGFESLAILRAFGLGLRYDLAAIALLNAVFFLLAFVPRWGVWRWAYAGLWSILNGTFLAWNIFDVEYYKFTGKRLTLDSFAITNDIHNQVGQIALYYWYYSLLIVAIYAVIVIAGARILKTPAPLSWKSLGAAALTVIALSGLAMRGGWQTKPLIPAQAFVDDSPQLGVLLLNSSFTILKSSGKQAVAELNAMPWDKVRALVGQPQAQIPWTGPKPKNIILVVLESFSWEYVSPPQGSMSYTPFLQELGARGSMFPHAYANGRRSIDAIPALLADIPAWMEPPFITSPYQTNRVVGLPAILSKNGFSTLFFHGGNNGTMFFDLMAKRFGFQSYIGANEYPKSGDHDGKWGIFDEPFLQYMNERLSQESSPFFATVFTLSSHHPYTIPPQHKDRFPKGNLEIHESIGYADYALRRFYEDAQKQAWFKDTLFVFTADHTSKFEFPSSDTLEGRFHVPLLFIMNDAPLAFPTLDNAVQHVDFSRTVLDLLSIQTPELSHFGSSLCRPLARPGIVLFEANAFHLIGSEQSLSWWTDGRTDPPVGNESRALERDFLSAEAHYFNNGMVRNRLLW